MQNFPLQGWLHEIVDGKEHKCKRIIKTLIMVKKIYKPISKAFYEQK